MFTDVSKRPEAFLFRHIKDRPICKTETQATRGQKARGCLRAIALTSAWMLWRQIENKILCECPCECLCKQRILAQLTSNYTTCAWLCGGTALTAWWAPRCSMTHCQWALDTVEICQTRDSGCWLLAFYDRPAAIQGCFAPDEKWLRGVQCLKRSSYWSWIAAM